MSSSSTPNQSANTSCVDRRANRPHILRAYSHAILKHFRAPAGQPRLSAQNLPGAILPITCLANVLLSQNKPLLLGSLDIPGTTRHEEVTVVAELIH